MITLALSKGRILDEAMPLLAAAGIALADQPGMGGNRAAASADHDVGRIRLAGLRLHLQRAAL